MFYFMRAHTLITKKLSMNRSSVKKRMSEHMEPLRVFFFFISSFVINRTHLRISEER